MARDERWVTPKEAAEILGMKNAEKIREALRAGSFPIGCAYKADGKWCYKIPRDPLEYFARTGRIPEVGEPTVLTLDGENRDGLEDIHILRAAAAIYSRIADKLEGVSA